jgi:hypothetical protein
MKINSILSCFHKLIKMTKYVDEKKEHSHIIILHRRYFISSTRFIIKSTPDVIYVRYISLSGSSTRGKQRTKSVININ